MTTPSTDAMTPDAETTTAPETVPAPEATAAPDVGFTLSPLDTAAELSRRIARETAELGPPGWRRVQATFSMTVAGESTALVFTDDNDRVARVFPTESVLASVREHRHLSASLGDGPWWRFLMTLTDEGQLEVDYDYGDEPFPDDQLFAPEVYRADLTAYPRSQVPLWLAAYVGHGGRQSRPPRLAAAQARDDEATGRVPLRCGTDTEFPDFPVLVRRWAVIAAGFVAVGSMWGPRVAPSTCVFEGARRSGSTLQALPGDRAVLSGGVWNAPALAAVYQDGAESPDLYRGAPAWVADPVLNARTSSGLLSFCYWWADGHWYRADSPGAGNLAEAVPGMWTADIVAGIIAGLLADEPSEFQHAAARRLVADAEAGVVTRASLAEVFDGDFDVDGAYFQLTVAGATTPDAMVAAVVTP